MRACWKPRAGENRRAGEGQGGAECPQLDQKSGPALTLTTVKHVGGMPSQASVSLSVRETQLFCCDE